MIDELWRKCVQFHGHECPGLAIGFKVCEAAMLRMGLEFSTDEEVVCVTENDACGVDAVQVIAGCTFGKGNLIYRPVGKMAFTFFTRSDGKGERFVLRPDDTNMTKEERLSRILGSDAGDLLDIGDPGVSLPNKAKIYRSVSCQICHERTAEPMMRVSEGKIVCIDCFKTKVSEP